MTTGYLSGLINDVACDDLREPRLYVGASSIGKPCLRSLYYGLHDPGEEDIDSKQQRTFDIGKILESMLLGYIEKAGFKIIRPNKANHFLGVFDDDLQYFRGHMDAILVVNGKYIAIVEIKTAKHSSFNIFKNKGLKIWYPVYYAQVQSYMGMSGIHQAYVLALNKDTSELHDELVKFDAVFYEELKQKAKLVKKAVLPPPKINGSPLYFMCKMCSHKRICHD